MKANDWLRQATQQLAGAGIGTARLDALVLLEHVLGKDRSWLLAHPEIEVSEDAKNVLSSLLTRREGHEPLAYLLGKTEFYGREFIITPAVLEPRPESETMIELLLTYAARHPELVSGSPGIKHVEGNPNSLDSSLRWNDAGEELVAIADVGAGSGALGITAQLELKNAQIDLLELDNKAIEVAKSNVIKFATGQKVIKSDLLAQAPRDYDILLCNLPYVPDDFQINEAAKQEPEIAIFGGPDGLDLYRTLFNRIKKSKNKPLLILTESLPPQHEVLARIARDADYNFDSEDDFIQVFSRG